ncbi:hypothetical protein MUP95_10195 [bacterium]|nr:hypothetical protein [bacterium]
MSGYEKVPETCPYCKRELSPWEKVLLSVDRALMCKGCWYRIVLDAFNGTIKESDNDKKDT